MSDLSKALDILSDGRDKGIVRLGTVISVSDGTAVVAIGEVEVEASVFHSCSARNRVLLIFNNNRYYIIGRLGG